MFITCIIIILSNKNNNIKEQRDSKEIDKNKAKERMKILRNTKMFEASKFENP